MALHGGQPVGLQQGHLPLDQAPHRAAASRAAGRWGRYMHPFGQGLVALAASCCSKSSSCRSMASRVIDCIKELIVKYYFYVDGCRN